MTKRTRRTDDTAEQRFRQWLEQYHTPELLDRAQALPLRRDMVTLITYVRDHKVVGTQSTGNMPLKAIREVTAHFVKPPVLDTTIGEHTDRLRTEYDVWPLYFMHILAEVGGLLLIAPARRWRLAPDAPAFLHTDPLLQLSFLLYVWWFEVNWLVAYPFQGMGEDLPASFTRATLARLRSFAVGTPVEFERFADGLIAITGLTWSVPDSSGVRMFLRNSVERMVVRVLANFGVVTCTYRPSPLLSSLKDLDAFEVTPLGKALLDSLALQGGQ
jgi:hypothetical protein